MESCLLALTAKKRISYCEHELTFDLNSTMQTMYNQKGLIKVGILGRILSSLGEQSGWTRAAHERKARTRGLEAANGDGDSTLSSSP